MSIGSETPRRRNWTGWLLLASLVVNGLLGGYLVGQVVAPDWGMRHSRMGGERGVPFSLSGLPTPLRDAMRAKLREHRDDARAQFESLRAARRELRDAIAAEPFDAKRLEAAFASLRNAQNVLQQDLHAIAVEVLGEMTPEDRKRLSEWRPEGRDRDRDRERDRGER